MFKGWKADAKAQARLNPWVEFEKAREKRDAMIRKYGVRLLDFITKPKTPRIEAAQNELIRHMSERGWDRYSAIAYLGRPISRKEWIKIINTKVPA